MYTGPLCFAHQCTVYHQCGSISNPVSMDAEFSGSYPPRLSFPYLALWNKQTENLLLLGFCIWGWHLSPGICRWQVQSQFVSLHQIQSLCRPESRAYKQKQGALTISISPKFFYGFSSKQYFAYIKSRDAILGDIPWFSDKVTSSPF